MKYTLIDTAGQLTAIIDQPITKRKRIKFSQNLLKRYPSMGQVAFINNDVVPLIAMMGNELSINGSIAGAYWVMRQKERSTLTFKTSGLNEVLNAQYKANICTVKYPNSVVKAIQNEEVVLSGIKYRFIKSKNEISIESANSYCANDLAAGYVVEIKPGEIIPVVYVRDTNTLITETACGSASLAYSLLTGFKNITQPSGSVITIRRSSGTLSISTECKEIYV